MQQKIESSFANLFARALLSGSFLGAVLLGGSCGVEAPTGFREYALRQAQAQCQRTFRCCGTRCSTTADANFNKSIEGTVYALQKGLVIYNEAQGQACLEANDGLYSDCNQYVGLIDSSRVSDACTGVLEGTLPLGAACSTGSADWCKPMTYCAPDASFTPAQLRCRRMAQAGEDCTGGIRCVQGTTCSTTTTPRTCVATPPQAHFAEACGATTGCASSLACLPTGTCGLPLEGGQACTTDAQCLSGRCAVDTCTLSMTKPQTVADLVCP